MDGKVCESDWKRYSSMVPGIRERYLERRNLEIIQILLDSGKTPTERFWDAREKSDEVKRILQDCFDGSSRSRVFFSLSLMLRHGMLTPEELEGFSEKLQSDLKDVAKP